MDGNDWSQACGLISDIKTWTHRKQDLVDDIYHPRYKQSSIDSFGTHPGKMSRQEIVVSMGLKEGYRPALVGSLGGSGVT